LAHDLHLGDLPTGVRRRLLARHRPPRPWGCGSVAIRFAAQIRGPQGEAHVVQFRRPAYDAPNLKRLLVDPRC